METRLEHRGSVTVAVPVGRIDFTTNTMFERALAEALDAGARRLVVDFGSVEFISSAGIRTLITVSRRLSANKGTLALCGLTEPVRQVLDISGLLPMFTTLPSIEEAVARLASPDEATPL